MATTREYRLRRRFMDGRWMVLERFGPWDEEALALRNFAEEQRKLKDPTSMQLVWRDVTDWEEVPTNGA